MSLSWDSFAPPPPEAETCKKTSLMSIACQQLTSLFTFQGSHLKDLYPSLEQYLIPGSAAMWTRIVEAKLSKGRPG